MIYSVILAGGSGTRFWPLSRRENPKQFLSIVGDKPLILQTKERALKLSPSERIRVVTTANLAQKITSLGFSKENIIIEPKGMNTLYAVALSAAKLLRVDRDALMLILPADHWIADNEQFLSVIKKGFTWAEKGNLVTYGIIPTRPETGYGYIKKGKELEDGILKVERFTEKPNVKKASSYLKSNKFLWNSGIFLWRADTILSEIKRYQPHLRDAIDAITKDPSKENIDLFYMAGAPISIDYGVLERSNNVLVVISDFKWDDIGTWNSLERLFTKGDNGNIENGEIHTINSHNNIIYAENGIIVTKGLESMIVVHTKRATLIIPKSDAQEVKEIVNHLPEKYT